MEQVVSWDNENTEVMAFLVALATLFSFPMAFLMIS